MTVFGADEIRIGEALFRSEAHLSTSCELYGAGRKPDALLQAARPITDVLPWLETEVRSAEGPLKAFYAATSSLGAEIRRNVRPRALRRALKEVEATRRQLLNAAVGEVAEQGDYRASVGVALLEGAAARYRRGIEDESLGDYQTAYALVSAGTGLLHEAGADDEHFAKLFASVDAVFPAVDPPEKLTRPDDVDRLVAEIAAVAEEVLGAQRLQWTLQDALGKVDRLVGDVVGSYESGLGPLSARLASSLFVRSYDPIRRELAAAAPDAEARLTSLLGFELRTAINENAPHDRVRALAQEAHDILVTLCSDPATKRDTRSHPG